MPKAAAMRTRSAAVGLVLPRSIVLSMAFDTSDRSASSASDQSRMILSACILLPMVEEMSFAISVHTSIIAKFRSRKRAVSRSIFTDRLNRLYTIRPHATLTPFL